MNKQPIIHKPSKSILLNGYVEEVLNAIPRSKKILVGGREVTAIAHGIDEVNWLRGNGYDNIPTPIETYYDFPLVKSKFEAFEHQKITAGFITLNKRNFVFNSMGTGKTESILYAVDFLKKQGLINKVLIVSPLSTISKVWGDALFTSFYWLTHATLYGSAARRKELLNEDVDVFIINYEGLRVLRDEIIARKDIDMIIFDEGAVLRTGDTKLYSAAHDIAKLMDRVVIATASPCPSGPENAWSLAKIINPTGVSKYFGSWKRLVLQQISPFRWIQKQDSHLHVNAALQPAILFNRDECLDLPECTTQRREVELSTEQRKLFKEMKKDMALELSSGVAINAVNGADKILKILQIVGGSVKNPETGEYHDLECKSRINTLLEVIEESEKKVIVFADFTGALKLITRELKKHKITAEYVNGEVTSKARNDIFERFQNSPDPQVLICNSRTASHGLNLVVSSCICWWTPIFSFERFSQASGRINRPGQDTKTNIVLLGSSAFEWELYDRLDKHDDNLTNILDMYKTVIESEI